MPSAASQISESGSVVKTGAKKVAKTIKKKIINSPNTDSGPIDISFQILSQTAKQLEEEDNFLNSDIFFSPEAGKVSDRHTASSVSTVSMDDAKAFMAAAKNEITEFTDELFDEDFVILDLEKKDSVDSLVQRVFGDVTKASAARQFAIGGATGWATGYVACRVGKTLAFTIGSTLLVLQLAQYNGIIKLDWSRINYAMTRARAKARAEVAKRQQSWFNSAHRFYEKNFFLASGFAGGFLFGFLF